jgi:hypothetical protein
MKKQLFIGVAMVGLLASSGIIAPPETLDQVKGVGQKILMAFPQAITTVWKEQVMPILNTMLGIGKDLWATYVWPYIGPEVNKRKALIPGELQKSKQELSQELQVQIDIQSKGIFQGLWDRFKTLLP